MLLERSFHRTSFRRKFLLICTAVAIYVLFFDGFAFVNHLKKHILSLANYGDRFYLHSYGQMISSKNGSFLYFHLPDLNDFNIDRDFYQLNSIAATAAAAAAASHHGKGVAKYCLKRGADWASINAANEHIFCVCKQGYTGDECAIPEVIQQIKSSVNITRLSKPRRIVMSLIWLTHDYANGNETTKAVRLDRFGQTLQWLAQYVDLFVLHEVRLLANESTSSSSDTGTKDECTLEYQLQHGNLSIHQPYTLFYSHVIPLPITKLNGDTATTDTMTQIDLDKIEASLMRQSWNIFTTMVTEYRPIDYLCFLSINNFPTEELMLYLKYHTGFMDVMNMVPLQRTTVRYQYGGSNDSLTLHVASEPSTLSSTTGSSENITKLVNNTNNTTTSTSGATTPANMYHRLQNVIFTFEYCSQLCKLNYDQFVTNYCLTDQTAVRYFERNHWPINLMKLGADSGGVAATFAIY